MKYRLASNDFLKVNVLMRRDNRKYTRPLNNEVNDVIDVRKNKVFKYVTAK